MRELVPSKPTLASLALCVLILVVAGLDLAHTESRLADVSTPGCKAEDSSCFNARLSEQLARDRAAVPLQDQYDSRAWLYAFAILAAGAVATAYDLRSTPRRRWPRIFTNLGVIGVWLGIAAVIALVATDGDSITVPAAPALMLPVVLLVAAAAGALVGRSEGWAQESQAGAGKARVVHVGRIAVHLGTRGQSTRSRVEQLGRWLSIAAVGLTAVTAVFALAFVLAQPACQSDGSPPDWSDPINAVAAVSAVSAVAAGIGALVLRRWLAALISLAVCPVALLLVLASTCAFY
jgi:hypothetical protein